MKQSRWASEPDFTAVSHDVVELARRGRPAAFAMTDDQVDLALIFVVALRDGVGGDEAWQQVRRNRLQQLDKMGTRILACLGGGALAVAALGAIGWCVEHTVRALVSDLGRVRGGQDPQRAITLDGVFVGLSGAVFVAAAAITTRLAYAGARSAHGAIQDWLARDMLTFAGRTTLADARTP